MSRELTLRHRSGFGGGPVSLAAMYRGWRDRPGVVMFTGALVAGFLAALEIVNPGGAGAAFQDLHVVVAALTTTLAMAILARRPDPGILRYRPLSYAIAITGAGMIMLDLTPTIGVSMAALSGNLLFLCGGALSMAVIVPSLYRRLDGRALAAAALDGGIVVCAGTTLMLTIWHNGQSTGVVDGLLVPVLAASLFASAGVAAIVALTLRVAPAVRGVWCGIVAVSLAGFSWILFVDLTLRGQPRDTATSLLYSSGILLAGYAWMTWNEDIGGGRTYERVARSLVDWLPIGAILLCVAVAAIPHGHVQGVDPAPIGTAAVVLLSISRQRLLIVRERWASHRLAGEVEERAQTMVSLARLERAPSPERTAARICDEALRLDGIETAAVYIFGPLGDVTPLAVAGEHRAEDAAGEPLDPVRSLHLQAAAGTGAWIDTPAADAATAIGPLLGEAFAPMRWDDRVVGIVSMGTTSEENAKRLAGRLPTLSEFGVVSAALLGPMLADRWGMVAMRSQLDSIIAGRAFTPVFQAVVQLNTRAIVGFEALTRFHDGTRPDQRFNDAHTAGMSVRLETACLGEQLEAASWLPRGTWVSLNVSPALAGAIVPLIAALERADREVVLEITEHVEISDYRQLVAALDLVRGRARLAVDDAGAGYAGLRHILEIKPQFVKLDISLVRHVDTDQARQAMVAGMAHFARNANCELIAEGIETEAELNELIRLGVPLGQGYLFGKPAPISFD
jgi:EAL domain-containing protein (putative c-di-GMP-specific phosphodiesterase class I)